MKKGKLFLLCQMTFVVLLISSLHAQMIVNIDNDVITEFGTYRPYPAIFTPNVPLFTVESEFSNVENWSSLFGLSSIDTALLKMNHFTVKKSQYTQLFDIYNSCTWDGIPIFVTSDAVLHIYHVLFDCFLAEIEVEEFIPTLAALTNKLIEQTQTIYTSATEPELVEAVYYNLAFLSVSQKLLEGDEFSIPETVSALVDSELTLIQDHDGFHISPIFGNFSALDYSQFIPRGHYTKNDTLTAYFKSMMWQGWTIFTMEPHLFGDLAFRHTLQALLLVQMLYNLDVDGEPLLNLWEKIYEPTVFFVGKTDDPNIKDYKAIADQVYGSDFLTLSPDSLSSRTLLGTFMTAAQQLPEPKIPNWIYGSFVTYKGFRLMGQRFIPDSYMFAHLVLPEIPDRHFPKGLDVMTILGSDRAYELLDSLYNETAYVNYPEKITSFKTEFATISPAEWAQNLYWNWLYCLMPLLYEKGENYPFFMQTIAWADKELMTALASWAELRHDTILYAKQSMSPCCITPGPPKSYVEPNPHLYARLASLVRFTRDGLESRDLLLSGFEEKLLRFEDLLLFLRDISIKELENTPLSDSEYENIYCFGRLMQYLVSDSDNQLQQWNSHSEDMAVVADVHTDSNTGECLEEGVGYPLEIYVIVNEGGSVRLTKGAVFSYYEFRQPINNRLTDEAWRDLLAGDSPPAMPEWTSSFTDLSSSQPDLISESVENLYYEEFSTIDYSDNSQIPEKIQLLQNYPNPFNGLTTIEFYLTHETDIELMIYDLNGALVEVIESGRKAAGRYFKKWNAAHYPSGLYFLQLRVNNQLFTRKLILLK